jgi:threonine synthase
MKFFSVLHESPSVGFREALFRGLAPDGGLYIPEHIPPLPHALRERLETETLHSIGYHVLSGFITEIPAEQLKDIVRRALNFPIPLVHLEEGISLLELFHGPTLAFKDVGARFMAAALSFFLSKERKEVSILVATSGDTGSAVAHSFYQTANITVYILYPSGKISSLQEQQMATLGGNIHAVEVNGTFDDCQRLVKESLIDKEILSVRTLTTANSMNLGRLLPQITYYVWGMAQAQQMHFAESASSTVVVPSGNVGNLTAAAYAKRMGTPIRKLIAATNINDVVPQYLSTGSFTPRPSRETLSNAMDVGNPSNLARLQSLYGNDAASIRNDIDAASVTDEEILQEIQRTYTRTGYILDPHTAVGTAVTRTLLARGSITPPVIVAATAHPAKFPDTVRRAINIEPPLPPPLLEALNRTKQSTRIPPSFKEWKALLLSGR